MSDQFSTPAEHAIFASEHEVDDSQSIAGPSSNGDASNEWSVEEAFEVEDTVRIILDGGYKTVCPSKQLSLVVCRRVTRWPSSGRATVPR